MKDFAQSRLVSIFCSLMVTCSVLPSVQRPTFETAGPGNMPAAMSDALKGLTANGWTTPGSATSDTVAVPMPASAQAASGDALPISADQLSKLIGKTLASTVQGPVSQRMTEFLGLTQGDAKLMVKQLLNRTDGTSHVFTVPVDGSLDRLIFIVLEENRIRWIVTDRSGRMVPGMAGASIRRGEGPMFLSDRETQELFNSEIRLWAEAANQI